MPSLREHLGRLGLAAASSKAGGLFYHVVACRIDRLLIPLSGGRLSMGPPGRTALFTTTGARTGMLRTVSLAFEWYGDEMVIIASKGGHPRHPGWYHNLKSDPHVRVRYQGVDEIRVAREAKGAERERLYAEMASAFPTFTAYQARAGARQIPVLLLARERANRPSSGPGLR